ncbi:MAG: hypothetical protein IJ691_09000 [Lachnospiraceae bacterium]|nr:hypothetical protein [Lachnospiraceae bacterium]
MLWGLSKKENIELSVIASRERKERFEKEGFYINDQSYKPVIKTPAEAHGADLFEGTGLHYRETDVILPEIWSKYRLNVGNNQAQAMLGVGVGAYSDSEHVAAIREGLISELEKIAKAKGIDLSSLLPRRTHLLFNPFSALSCG